MDYLSRHLVSTTDDEGITPSRLWISSCPVMALWVAVMPSLTVPQRKVVLTAMRVQRPILESVRLLESFDASFRPQDSHSILLYPTRPLEPEKYSRIQSRRSRKFNPTRGNRETASARYVERETPGLSHENGIYRVQTPLQDSTLF